MCSLWGNAWSSALTTHALFQVYVLAQQNSSLKKSEDAAGTFCWFQSVDLLVGFPTRDKPGICRGSNGNPSPKLARPGIF